MYLFLHYRFAIVCSHYGLTHHAHLFFQVELEDPVENIGAKLVRQAAAKTNDLAGDGTTTSVVLAQGMITEGVKVHQRENSCLGAYIISVLYTYEKKSAAFPRL